MEAKGNRKIAVSQIKIIAASKAAPANSGRNLSARLPCKKKASTSFLPSHRQQGKKISNHSCAQRYCVLCKKSGISEHKWKMHSYKNFLVKRYYQASIKEGLEENLGNKAVAVNQYQKSENKWTGELEYIKKQNKMFFRMSKRSCSRRELKKIKKSRRYAPKHQRHMFNI